MTTIGSITPTPVSVVDTKPLSFKIPAGITKNNPASINNLSEDILKNFTSELENYVKSLTTVVGEIDADKKTSKTYIKENLKQGFESSIETTKAWIDKFGGQVRANIFENCTKMSHLHAAQQGVSSGYTKRKHGIEYRIEEAKAKLKAGECYITDKDSSKEVSPKKVDKSDQKLAKYNAVEQAAENYLKNLNRILKDSVGLREKIFSTELELSQVFDLPNLDHKNIDRSIIADLQSNKAILALRKDKANISYTQLTKDLASIQTNGESVFEEKDAQINKLKEAIASLERSIESAKDLQNTKSIEKMEQKIALFNFQIKQIEITRKQIKARLENTIALLEDLKEKYDCTIVKLAHENVSFHPDLFANQKNIVGIKEEIAVLNLCNSSLLPNQLNLLQTKIASLYEKKSTELNELKKHNKVLRDSGFNNVPSLKVSIQNFNKQVKPLVDTEKALREVSEKIEMCYQNFENTYNYSSGWKYVPAALGGDVRPD